MNLNYLIICALVMIYIITSLLMALSFFKDGGLEITEAAQELNNEKLHSAGVKINKGANILYNLYLISIVLSVIITVVVLAVDLS